MLWVAVGVEARDCGHYQRKTKMLTMEPHLLQHQRSTTKMMMRRMKKVEKRYTVHWSYVSPFVTLYTSLSELFSPYYFLYISRCWQGECFEQSRASLVGDHFMYSHDLSVWFRSVTVMRNYLPVTLGSQRVIHNGKLWATENLLVS